MDINCGVIGFGRFGKLLTQLLAKNTSVIVFQANNDPHEIKACGATPGTLQEVCACDIVIPCVPISEFEGVLHAIKDKLREGTLVADVCSVKELPAALMEKILPAHVDILATHPMFGPDSAPTDIKKRKIVVCKVRISDERYSKVKSFFEKQQLVVIETTPTEHDKQIAQTQILTHLIGRALVEHGATAQEIDTEGYKRLMHILEVVQNDTWQLFKDMNRYNQYAQAAREQFIAALQKVHTEVHQ